MLVFHVPNFIWGIFHVPKLPLRGPCFYWNRFETTSWGGLSETVSIRIQEQVWIGETGCNRLQIGLKTRSPNTALYTVTINTPHPMASNYNARVAALSCPKLFAYVRLVYGYLWKHSLCGAARSSHSAFCWRRHQNFLPESSWTCDAWG